MISPELELWLLQAKEQADSGQTQGHNAGMSDDLQAEWRMRAGSALDDLRAQPTEHYDSLNIQVPASDVSVVCDSLLFTTFVLCLGLCCAGLLLGLKLHSSWLADSLLSL